MTLYSTNVRFLETGMPDGWMLGTVGLTSTAMSYAATATIVMVTSLRARDICID